MFSKNGRKVCFVLVLIWLNICLGVVNVKAKDGGIGFYQGLVNVSGTNFYCKLDGGLNPVVVLDAAYGKDHNWTNALADELRKTDKVDVFQYDRAGLGESEMTKNSRTPVNKARELHSILNARGVTKFYYIGYALSGFTIREYAYLYPNEVQGIVTLDCTTEDQIEGIEVFLNSLDKSLLKNFKDNFNKEDGTYEELKEGVMQIKKIKKFDSLRNIPLTAISGDDHGFGEILRACHRDESLGLEMESKWQKWQTNLTDLSDKSIHITLNVYSNFRKKTEVKSLLKMMEINFTENDYIDESLLFSEGVYGNNLPLFRFFAFIGDGLGL